MKCSNCRKVAIGFTKGSKFRYLWCKLCYEKKGKFPESSYYAIRCVKKLYSMQDLKIS